MTLSPGTKLGQYEVVESIGAGGMGEVYRASDTKLGRDVAVKVLFSFGVVLYEMLTGRRPFSGETPAEILSSIIIKYTPDSTSDLNRAIPRDLAKLFKRCLAMDPIRRYPSAVDLRNDLEETKQEAEVYLTRTNDSESSKPDMPSLGAKPSKKSSSGSTDIWDPLAK